MTEQPRRRRVENEESGARPATNLEKLRNRLAIDRDELDTELVQQPTLVYEARAGLAAAISLRDGQKDHLNQIEGPLRANIQDQSESKKMTVKDIDAALEATEEWIKARVLYRGFSNAVNEWEALVEAVRSRDFMLKALNDSIISQRWADGPGQAATDPSLTRSRQRA